MTKYMASYEAGCAKGLADDCFAVGEARMRRLKIQRWSDEYFEVVPVDEKAAEVAYRRGCELNSVRACAALVERHMLDSRPQEREALVRRVQALGWAIRTDEEIEQTEAEAASAQAKNSERIRQAQRAGWAEGLSAGASVLAQGGAQLQARAQGGTQASADGFNPTTVSGGSALGAPCDALLAKAPPGTCGPSDGSGFSVPNRNWMQSDVNRARGGDNCTIADGDVADAINHCFAAECNKRWGLNQNIRSHMIAAKADIDAVKEMCGSRAQPFGSLQCAFTTYYPCP